METDDRELIDIRSHFMHKVKHGFIRWAYALNPLICCEYPPFFPYSLSMLNIANLRLLSFTSSPTNCGSLQIDLHTWVHWYSATKLPLGISKCHKLCQPPKIFCTSSPTTDLINTFGDKLHFIATTSMTAFVQSGFILPSSF